MTFARGVTSNEYSDTYQYAKHPGDGVEHISHTYMAPRQPQ